MAIQMEHDDEDSDDFSLADFLIRQHEQKTRRQLLKEMEEDEPLVIESEGK